MSKTINKLREALNKREGRIMSIHSAKKLRPAEPKSPQEKQAIREFFQRQRDAISQA